MRTEERREQRQEHSIRERRVTHTGQNTASALEHSERGPDRQAGGEGRAVTAGQGDRFYLLGKQEVPGGF